MASMKFAENFYSFRATKAVIGTYLQPAVPDQAVLQRIEATLLAANNDFLGRKYQEAIREYQDAAGMIYGQINPRYPIGVRGIELPLDTALFDPMLSASLEWMNVVPPRQPVVPVTSRLPVNPATFGKAAALDETGIVSTALATHPAMMAAAEVQAARTLSEQGNSAGADFFSKRAQADSAATAKLLVAAAAPAVAAPAVAAPAVALAGAGVAVASPMATVSHVAPVETALSSVRLTSLIALPTTVSLDRTVGFLRGGQAMTFQWKAGDAPPIAPVKTSLYEQRVALSSLTDIIYIPQQPSDVAAQLPHDYYYVIPLGLAECYHALGDYANAEAKYFAAASYAYLNAAVEAPYLFQRLLTLYLDWGNSLFRNDQAPDAMNVYTHVMAPTFAVPATPLYATASLKPGADVARQVIGNLANAPTLNLNPTIVSTILEIWQQMLKIENGLDYWGYTMNSVPIWTFDYLQSVAVNFTQLAVSAERDVINFRDRADQAALTRLQITQSVAQSNSELQTTKLQASEAQAEVAVYQDGLALAQQRATNATANANEYAATSGNAIVHQALSAQLSGGDDGDASQLNAFADAMMSGSYSLSGSRGTLAASEQLTASRLNRQYEIDALKRDAAELQTARVQAQAEVTAAQIRANVAQSAVNTARLRAAAAQQSLDAFDNQFFTPDIWYRMGDEMWRLYRRYFDMAIRSARLMQQAYNFETDQSMNVIKVDYSTDEVKGLLGADALMADIQSFTYDLITSKLGKPQPLRQTISLAQSYGYQFENQFRTTGSMDFSTRIEDFDMYYPGTFAGRIESVEVNIDGIVPATGISGTLTNSGISAYRTPASVAADPNGLKYRVQNRETLVLSDYAVRNDGLLVHDDSRMMKVFEGAGVSSSWTLSLPKSINDINYGALTDVRITFYYKARYDPDLRDKVVATLAARPGFTSRQRGMPLRWLFPDAFFRFQDTGELTFSLSAPDFRNNETKPTLDSVGILVSTDGSVAPTGLKASLATPTKAAILATTDAGGLIDSSGGTPWAPLASGTALGNFSIKLAAADNPALVKNGKLTLTPITNIGFILGYSFTPRA